MKIRRLPQACLTILLLAMAFGLQAEAPPLDAKAARDLVSDRQWQQPQAHGSGQLFWSWKADGSACLRTDGAGGQCADTGRWTLEGNRMCYELTWWGKSSGRNPACFRILDKGNARFEAMQDNGLTLFEFTVVR
jgi:hypothetical protein